MVNYVLAKSCGILMDWNVENISDIFDIKYK